MLFLCWKWKKFFRGAKIIEPKISWKAFSVSHYLFKRRSSLIKNFSWIWKWLYKWKMQINEQQKLLFWLQLHIIHISSQQTQRNSGISKTSLRILKRYSFHPYHISLHYFIGMIMLIIMFGWNFVNERCNSWRLMNSFSIRCYLLMNRLLIMDN